jgi:hypothetical protein
MTQSHRYTYHIDELGNWFCENLPVVVPELAAVLSRSVFEKDGRYFISCEGEIHAVAVADAPMVVRYVHPRVGEDLALESVEIELLDGRREVLDAESLEISPDNILYCRATGGGLRARFSKSAYYELMEYLATEGELERFYLVINGRRYYIGAAESG